MSGGRMANAVCTPQWHRLLLIHHSDDRHSDWHGRSRARSLAGLLGASATMNPPSRPARVQSGGREQRWARVCWPGLACQQFQLASSACGCRAHRRRAVSTTLRWKYRSRHRGRRHGTDVLLAKLRSHPNSASGRVASRIWCTCGDGRRVISVSVSRGWRRRSRCCPSTRRCTAAGIGLHCVASKLTSRGWL